MRRIVRPRRGIALVIALLAIVVVGALIVSAFFSSTQEYRIGRNTLVVQRAFAVAEYGLNSEIAGWDKTRYMPGSSKYMQPGDVDNTPVYVADGDTARVRVSRLNQNTFWVVSEGSAAMGVAQVKSMQRTNGLVRIAYPSVNVRGAVTARGDVSVSGSARVFGTDLLNSTDAAVQSELREVRAWDQCAEIGTEDKAGISVSSTATVDAGTGQTRIYGSPAVQKEAASGSASTYVQYGDETWSTLEAAAAAAGMKLPAVGNAKFASPAPTATAAGACNTADTMNWGEPYRVGTTVAACKNYFPIVYLDGSVHLNGGRGQGILMVNGDLDMNGGFEWYGIIIVRNEIKKGNGGAKVVGAVMSASATLVENGDGGDDDNEFIGNQNIFYSKCAVQSALSGSAPLVYVKERSWAQMF